MPNILISAAVMSLLRNEVTARCVADRFGVTEAQVLEWKDVFMIAGILGLSELGSIARPTVQSQYPAASPPSRKDGLSDPTTRNVARFGDPTTTRDP